MSGFRYGILGAGRQGTAAAYDLAVRGEAASITLGDIDPGRADSAAERLNRLTRTGIVTGARVDATNHDRLAEFLEPLDAFVSSATWRLNLGASEAALDAGTHMCDLGGNTPVVLRQLDLGARARERGICLVPDCGEAPGLSSNLLAYATTFLDRTESLLLLDGGIPEEPVPPWNYVLTFDIDGLTNEYHGTTTYLVDGKRVEVECFDPAEYELIDLGPPLGTLEAFAAATGSTTPWTLADRTRTLKAKVLRYPGHAAQFTAFRDLGLFGEDPIEVDGVEVIPRHVFHALMEPGLRPGPGVRDVVVARVVAKGTRNDRPSQTTVDLQVRPDEDIGFSAMERATGWHAAIVLHLMASGRIQPGATPVELAVDPALMVEELRLRGFDLTVDVT
jgi:lysine 6-dehydrogenase